MPSNLEKQANGVREASIFRKSPWPAKFLEMVPEWDRKSSKIIPKWTRGSHKWANKSFQEFVRKLIRNFVEQVTEYCPKWNPKCTPDRSKIVKKSSHNGFRAILGASGVAKSILGPISEPCLTILRPKLCPSRPQFNKISKWNIDINRLSLSRFRLQC